MTHSDPIFSIDDAGWCQQARRVPSPHHNERAAPDDISLLVVHGISLPPGEFGSAHCLIRRDGELVQYVPFGARAWHAGVSSWQGREACNDFSIGIELEGTDETPYTDAQYFALVGLTRAISARYPAVTMEKIVGHCDIAPGRKTDPGESFQWSRFREMLNS